MKIFRVLHVVKYLFVVLGLVFLLLTSVMYQNTLEFTKNAIHTTGVVTHTVKRNDVKGSSYSPAIRFQDQQGKTFEFVSSKLVKSSDYNKGDEVDILYDPSDPKGAVIEGFFSVWGLTLMFGYVGIMSLGFGLGAIIWFKRKAKKKRQLLSTGSPIVAEIQAISKNKRITLNGKHPYQIHAQWLNPATQKLHVFISDNIWFDPASFIKKNEIQVYINKNNLKMYYVDLSFLPDMAN